METPKRPYHRSNGQRLTRKRIPLSCVACRIRKLKCNREKPCQNCIVRGESNAASCIYAEKTEGKHQAKMNPRSDAEDMRKRIDRLEKSILSVISSEGGAASSAHVTEDDHTDEDDTPPYQAGGQKMSVDTRSTHWDAILNDLGAMKDAWSEENYNTETSSRSLSFTPKHHRPSLLGGLTSPPARSSVMASLPSRDAADKLIARFFGYYNPALPVRYVVHKATFVKQYNDHWADPSKTKIIWIGLLFGMLCHALQSYRQNDIEPPDYRGTMASTIELYRVRAAQCLAITDVTKPVKFMIEAMLVYSMAEYVDEGDGDMGTWLLSGYLVRLALQQGYHRDPSQHPNISVFDGEMRRRLWWSVSQHELLFSVKIGLPKGIRFAECDTSPPRNLTEEELYEDMKELPPSRPNTELTDISYFVIKYRIMLAYGHVIEFLHIVQPQPYKEVLRLDGNLIAARETIPPHFQLYPFEEMKNDPSYRIMERCILQLFYHKAVCLLHRKYWNVEPPDQAESIHYSRQRCVGSSVALLKLQAEMHHACHPGGSLSDMKWYHFAITNHDFLLAAMIICLDLMMINRIGESHPAHIPATLEKLNAIRTSRSIWAEIVYCCRDAKRAVTILTSVLNKLSDVMEETKSLYITKEETPIPALVTYPSMESLRFSESITDKPAIEKPVLIGQLEGGDVVMQDDLLSSRGIFDILASDPNLTTGFDWDAWDQLLANQQPEHAILLNYNQI